MELHFKAELHSKPDNSGVTAIRFIIPLFPKEQEWFCRVAALFDPVTWKEHWSQVVNVFVALQSRY